ncbi:unnamed protein product, partial [Chrysoparadoxa australica]
MLTCFTAIAACVYCAAAIALVVIGLCCSRPIFTSFFTSPLSFFYPFALLSMLHRHSLIISLNNQALLPYTTQAASQIFPLLSILSIPVLPQSVLAPSPSSCPPLSLEPTWQATFLHTGTGAGAGTAP